MGDNYKDDADEYPVKEHINVKVIKKSGNLEAWNSQKILNAVGKSAARIATKLSYIDQKNILEIVEHELDDNAETEVSVETIHSLVEKALAKVRPDVAISYMDYRNWVKRNAKLMDEVTRECNTIQFIGDKSNANADSNMVSTKRVKKLDVLETAQYREYFLNSEEKKAEAAGYIYIHDKGARQDTMNCFDRSTRFITSQGVKSFYDFCDGDEIIVLTHTGEWKKATVHSYGWQKVQKVKFKRGASKEKEIIVTENHRWLLKDGTETTNLKVGDKLIETPDITKFDFHSLSRENKKLWCLGFAYADGSIVLDNKIPTMHVRLCGDKKTYNHNFEEAGYNVTYPTSLNGDAHIRMQDIHSKEFPYFLLNYTNILYFINGFLCADGNKSTCTGNENSPFRGIQVTGEFNKYIYDLLNISGYYVTGMTNLTGQKTNYGTRKKETISYTIYSNCGDRTWFVTDIEPIKLNINAQVWCLEVEDNHSFILENGIPTGNCCIFDVNSVLSGGFEMGNVWYNEPKSLDVAFDVIGDITLMAASQQYGGFTIPEVDKLLSKYAEKTYQSAYKEEYEKLIRLGIPEEIAQKEAKISGNKQVKKEMRQGYQGWEYKFNTVASSRGDYPSAKKAA